MSMSRESSNDVQPRERDWNKVRAEIARLVEAVSALTSSMNTVDLQTKERKWMPVEEDCLEMFHPAAKEVSENLLNVFLSIFLRAGSGRALLGNYAFDLEKRNTPNFTDQLTLRLAVKIQTQDDSGGTHDFNPSKLCLVANQLEEHIKLTKKWRKLVHFPQCEERREWHWTPLSNGMFQLYVVSDEEPCCWRMAAPPRTELLGTSRGSFAKFGYGALMILKVPVRDSIIPFEWIQIILAQTGFLHYKISTPPKQYAVHLGTFINFLGTFAGNWSSRKERSQFLFRRDTIGGGGLSRVPFSCVQLHFRCFTVAESLQVSQEAVGNPVKIEGLVCKRQLAEIPSLALGVATRRFRERQISIFGILSAQHRKVVSHYSQAKYRVTILSEAGTEFPDLSIRHNSLRWRQGSEGVMAFQTAILTATSVWESEWAKTLDEIDNCVRFQLSQTMDPTQVSEWMFDLNFKRSSLYFTLLQILRIFGEYISTVSEDLKTLSSLFLDPANGLPFYDPRPDEVSNIESNWKMVIQLQKDAEERLLTRLLDKTEEVKSLRDGIFNATSLREANRSTAMNRYVIIFTVVTVIFLPPTFTSTLFALDFVKKANLSQSTREYKITTVILSLVTYLTAGMCIVAVNWRHIKDRVHTNSASLHGWRHSTTERRKMGGEKSNDVAGVKADDALPAPETEPASGKAEYHAPKSAAATRDLESAVEEAKTAK